jgi:hypothetical protein
MEGQCCLPILMVLARSELVDNVQSRIRISLSVN